MNGPDDADRRWRLVLGAAADDELGRPAGADRGIDEALAALYEPGPKKAGLGASAPSVARWLGDIRRYFPTPVVSLLQRDAVERLDLEQLLLEPELLDTLEPNVDLVATLIGLGDVMPAHTRDTARAVVRKVTRRLEARLRERLLAALRGSVRSQRTRRPRARDIDWPRTLLANLKNAVVVDGRVLPVPASLRGWRRRDSALGDVILCVDQSGSMAHSLVYAGVMAAVMASVRSVATRFVVFDTEIVDLTDHLADPVDVLFGAQLGGGTDIARVLAYCQTVVRRPDETVLVLVSDLHDVDPDATVARAAALVQTGVRMVTLLALSDEGTPDYDGNTARRLAALGVPCFACTPDRFPELMAAALAGVDTAEWHRAGERSCALAELRAPRARR